MVGSHQDTGLISSGHILVKAWIMPAGVVAVARFNEGKTITCIQHGSPVDRLFSLSLDDYNDEDKYCQVCYFAVYISKMRTLFAARFFLTSQGKQSPGIM